MGTVLGKIGVETPKYSVVADCDECEIREYSGNLVAEVTYDSKEMKGGRDGGFTILASYIGAVGKPANVKEGSTGEKIAMTAPVITRETESNPEKIAMTAPVITQDNETAQDEGKKLVTMQFVLPSSYSLETAPKPTDERVKLKEVPSTKYGVLKFSGVANDKLSEQKLEVLKNTLRKHGYQITGQHFLARYNPPWTPGFLRTNEVMVPVA